MKVLALLLAAVGLAATAHAAPPTISDFNPKAGPVGSQVVIVGTGFTPPFSVSFGGNVQAAGSFTSTQVTVTVPSGAQTGPITINTSGGSTMTASNFVVGAASATPAATVAVTTPTASVSTGQPGEYTVTLSSAPANNVVVNYALKGTAVNGTDYQLLTGTVKIKSGKTSKAIKIVPQGDLGGTTKKTVKLTLESGTGYTVGTTTAEKVKIVP